MILASHLPQADILYHHYLPDGRADPHGADVSSLELIGTDAFDVTGPAGVPITVRRVVVRYTDAPAFFIADHVETNEDDVPSEQIPERVVIAIGQARARLAALSLPGLPSAARRPRPPA